MKYELLKSTQTEDYTIPARTLYHLRRRQKISIRPHTISSHRCTNQKEFNSKHSVTNYCGTGSNLYPYFYDCITARLYSFISTKFSTYVYSILRENNGIILATKIISSKPVADFYQKLFTDPQWLQQVLKINVNKEKSEPNSKTKNK